MFGLLALAGLQGRAITAQMESYQRSQALILLKDMADRISANRKMAAFYVTAEVGTGAACPAAGATTASKDLNEWCNALLGAAEVQGTSNIGVDKTTVTAQRPATRADVAAKAGGFVGPQHHGAAVTRCEIGRAHV